jgi:hypothetical protein
MAISASASIKAVQKMIRHASIATTERYTAVDDDEIRAAMVAAVACEDLVPLSISAVGDGLVID